MVLETPTIAGTTTEEVLSILPGVYVSVHLWTDLVNAMASEPCKMQSQNFTGV